MSTLLDQLTEGQSHAEAEPPNPTRERLAALIVRGHSAGKLTDDEVLQVKQACKELELPFSHARKLAELYGRLQEVKKSTGDIDAHRWRALVAKRKYENAQAAMNHEIQPIEEQIVNLSQREPFRSGERVAEMYRQIVEIRVKFRDAVSTLFFAKEKAEGVVMHGSVTCAMGVFNIASQIESLCPECPLDIQQIREAWDRHARGEQPVKPSDGEDLPEPWQPGAMGAASFHSPTFR